MRVYMGRGRAGSIDIRENVSKHGTLGGLLVHGAGSPDLPPPRIFEARQNGGRVLRTGTGGKPSTWFPPGGLVDHLW